MEITQQATWEGKPVYGCDMIDIINLVFPKLEKEAELDGRVGSVREQRWPTLGANEKRQVSSFKCAPEPRRTRGSESQQGGATTAIIGGLVVGVLAYALLSVGEGKRMFKVPYDGRLVLSVGCGVVTAILFSYGQKQEVERREREVLKSVDDLEANFATLLHLKEAFKLAEHVEERGYDSPEAFRNHFARLLHKYGGRFDGGIPQWGESLVRLYVGFELSGLDDWLNPVKLPKVEEEEELK